MYLVYINLVLLPYVEYILLVWSTISIRGSSLPFATIQWLNLHQLIHAMVFHPLYKSKIKNQKKEQHDVSTRRTTTSKQHGRPTLQQKRYQFGHFSFTTDRFFQLLFHSIFCIKKSCALHPRTTTRQKQRNNEMSFKWNCFSSPLLKNTQTTTCNKTATNVPIHD